MVKKNKIKKVETLESTTDDISAKIGGQKRPIDLPLRATIGDGDVIMLDSTTEGSYAATKETLAKEVASLILSQNPSLVGTFIHSYKPLDNLLDQDGKRMVIQMNGSQYLKSELSTEINNFINTTIRSLGLIVGTSEWEAKKQEFLTEPGWKDKYIDFYEGFYWRDLGDKWQTQNIVEPLKTTVWSARVGFVEHYSLTKPLFDTFINKLNSHTFKVDYRGPFNTDEATTIGFVEMLSNPPIGFPFFPVVDALTSGVKGVSTPVDSSGNPINFGANSPFNATTSNTYAGTPCYLYMIASKYWTNITASNVAGAVNSVNGMDGDVILKSGNIELTATINQTNNIQDCLQDLSNNKANLTDLSAKANLTDLDTLRNFTIKYTKTGLSTVINNNATALTNLINIINVSPTISSFGATIKGGDITAPSLISVANGFRLPVIASMVNYNIDFSIRITGAISGTAGTTRELVIYLRRLSDNSVVSNAGIIKVNDNNFNGRSSIITSFIKGVNDPFVVNGFYLDILNNSGANLTINTLELLIQSW